MSQGKLKYHDDVNSYADVNGNIPVSKKLLKPFVRELGFFSRNYNDAYREKNLIEEHMDFGAANAAKVLKTKPELIVAVISTDVDAVMLLSFRKSLVKKFNLKVNQKLLSINTYGALDTHRQKDLIEGPNTTGLWNICYPIIADFIAENKTALQKTTNEIDADEWKRLDELIEDKNKEVLPFVRNGNPYLSAEAPFEEIE